MRSRQRGGLVEVSSPAEADRKTLGTWGVWQSGWRSVAAKECFSCGAHWRAWVGRRHALVDRASDDATVRASGSKEEAAGGAVWRSVAIRSGAGQACRPGSQRSLRCGLRQHAQKQQSAAAGASLVGRQATLRGCDGYAHYPLAQWRNGQWADPMLAHAGAEAVRLVPFSSLLRLALLPNTAISMARR